MIKIIVNRKDIKHKRRAEATGYLIRMEGHKKKRSSKQI